MRHYTVSLEGNKLRLDQYLANIRPDFTRSFIQKLIKEGSVFVNNKKIIKPSLKVSEGDKLIVIIPSIKEIGIKAEDIALDIIYEDEDLIVVNKPSGMVVHPTDHGAHVSGTLVNAVMHYCKKELSGIRGKKKPGIVHRIDKDTTGLIMIAKDDKAHQHLSKQIQKRSITKKYLTLIKGHLEPQEGSIDAPILKLHGRKNVRISNQARAKKALTHYKVLDYIADYSLVEAQIITGRTHQIRVHFASIGHPVCGDSMYGDKKINEKMAELGLKRQFLHAAYLKIQLPKNDKWIELEAPLPEDLKEIIKNNK